ncbi:DUF4097 family beta strand repeat-containing protein [Agrilactobacillus composti]|nr:DUF4097 family beta strand repeat-containing protein [Agrilactobacillus composti]
MINGIIIDDALQRLFSGYPRTAEIMDFYQEVKNDVSEHAEDLLIAGTAKTPEAAVKAAVASLGDLNEVLQLISRGKTQPTPSESGVNAANNTQPAFTQSFDIAAVQNLDLAIGFGTVNFQQSPDNALHIRQDQKPELAAYRLALVQDGPTLHLKVANVSWLHYLTPFGHPHSTVTIALPKAFAGDISGQVSAGLLNFTNFQTKANFNLTIKASNTKVDQVQANNMNILLSAGNFKADGLITATLTVHTKASNIRLIGVQGQMDIAAHSGTIKAQDLSGFGSFSAHSGTIKAAWTKVNGDLHFSAHSGTVNVQTPADADFKFSLQARSGAVKLKRPAHYDLQVTGAAMGTTTNGNEPIYQLTATANSGTVVIA